MSNFFDKMLKTPKTEAELSPIPKNTNVDKMLKLFDIIPTIGYNAQHMSCETTPGPQDPKMHTFSHRGVDYSTIPSPRLVGESKYGDVFRSPVIEAWVDTLEGVHPGDEDRNLAIRRRLNSAEFSRGGRLDELIKKALSGELGEINNRFDTQHLINHLPEQVSELLVDTGVVVGYQGRIDYAGRGIHEVTYERQGFSREEIQLIHDAIKAGNMDVIAVALKKTSNDMDLEIKAAHMTSGYSSGRRMLSTMGNMVAPGYYGPSAPAVWQTQPHWQPWSQREMQLGISSHTQRKIDRRDEIERTLRILAERNLGFWEKPVVHKYKGGQYVDTKPMSWQEALRIGS